MFQIGLDSERLKALTVEDGKLLSDHVALLIGSVGENVSLRRAYCFQGGEGVTVAGYTHPAPQHAHKTLYGKYGALVAFRKELSSNNDEESAVKIPTDQIGRLLCQHIIGKTLYKCHFKYVII